MNYVLRFEQVGALKLKADVRIPATLVGGDGIKITNEAGIFTFDVDYSEYTELLSFDPAAQEVLLYNPTDGTYAVVTLATLINNSAGTIREVTEAGDIVVAPATQILLMNRTADINPSNIILPLASTKIGPLKLVDWKGNAGTYAHTILRSGADTFQGGATSRKLAGDRASTVLHPIPGKGYAA